jgi:MinD-like ATPase involved in chromosome partitioning or flagellar assembly
VSAEPRAFAFISLLRDRAEARGLAGLLEGLARPGASAESLFLVPEVRGLDFFAASAAQESLDRWWGANVPAGSLPVYLLEHERGLAAWMRGLDGVFLVAVGDADAGGYAQWVAVRSDADEAPLALADAVVARYGGAANSTATTMADVFDVRDVRMIAGLRAGAGDTRSAASAPARGHRADDAPQGPRAPVRPYSHLDLPPLLDLVGSASTPAAASRAAPAPADPIELLAAESDRAERAAPAWGSSRSETPAGSAARGLPAVRRLRHHLPLVNPWGRGAKTSDAELAALLLNRAPRIVVVGSRKGGVGKTSHAAGMAISGGAVLDSVGHIAAIVDANVANPDAWGQLNLPDTAATVRDVVAALAKGVQPPSPIHSVTPALACYPERREGTEYTHTDIHRLAAHLRAHYSLVIVDMSNRLPDPTSGPEAAVAAFWLEEADALVLPTAMSRQDFNGVLDYLDVRGRPPTVVPCIISGARRNRRHPVTREYLDVIASRVDRVLEVPDEGDNVRLAGMDGVPVQEVSSKMRLAYRALTEAVARLPSRTRA